MAFDQGTETDAETDSAASGCRGVLVGLAITAFSALCAFAVFLMF